MADMLAEMKALLAQLPAVTLVRVEAGPIAIEAIKAVAVSAPAPAPGLPLSPIWGVPLVPESDPAKLGPCCWRGIGSDGSTMQQGCVAGGNHA